MLSAIAEEHPVILVVDDLHLADDVSLAVLHLMMRKARTQPIMVLLIARPGELSQSPQAEKLRMAGGALVIKEMELIPLSDQESLQLLQSLIPDDQPRPSQTVQRALLRGAAGYPMVLELLVQDWQASGEQSLALSVDAMTTDPGGGGTPTVYRDILDRITRSLDPTTRNVLNLASLLGQRLNDPSMFGLVDLSVGQTMSGLADLVNRRVLRDGARGLEFVNEMVRAAAYVGVPATVRRVLHGKIADHLVLEHDRGTSDLGLEIAWHCMRAGRSLEATPHLLRGAREAIRTGVPFGAERGLATALPSLTGSSRTEAMVLLAEALQEQSRWDESLCFLDQVVPEAGSRLADMAFVLTTRARRRAGHLGSAELAGLSATLLMFIETARHGTSRITAAVEAASVLDTTNICDLAHPVLESISDIDEKGLSLEDNAHLLLARSMLFYRIKDFGSSMECIQEGVAMLKSCSASNSILAMLQMGVGAIFAKQGDYLPSIPAFQEAHQTAVRIGNDHIYLQASANLSLALTRLGEYEAAIWWAEQALASARTTITLTYRLQAARNCVLAHAMLGRTTSAERVLQQYEQVFIGEKTGGVAQAWRLYAADGLALLGKQKEAEAQGFLGTSGDNSRLQADYYVGSYARWVARSSLSYSSTAIGHERLDALLRNLSGYDAIDQAEILNAKAWLNAHTGVASTLNPEEINTRLERLPAAVRDQLAQMEMLAFLTDSRRV
jgi:tetratricopeptide (TPR) repeat protein